MTLLKNLVDKKQFAKNSFVNINQLDLLHNIHTASPMDSRALSSATWRPMFMQFTGCHQLVQRSYRPENANDWMGW